MAEPVSWLALDAMEAKAKLIRLASGYFTDAGAAPVLRERRQVDETAAPLMLLVGTTIDPLPDRSGPRTQVSEMAWSLEFVQPQDALGAVGPDQMAHRFRADLVRAFNDDLRSDVARISNLRIDGCEITGDTDSRGAAVVITQVTGRIDLTETKQPATP